MSRKQQPKAWLDTTETQDDYAVCAKCDGSGECYEHECSYCNGTGLMELVDVNS